MRNSFTSPGWGTGYFIVAGATDSSFSAGIHWEVDYDALEAMIGKTDILAIYTSGNTSTPAHTLTINIIPEPATIALLGLGGLILLRRRK